MKKIMLALLAALVSLSAFAERNKRINLTFDFGIGGVSADLGDDEKSNMLAMSVGADAEFMNITQRNWILGAKIGVHSIDREGSVSIYDYNMLGASFTIAPIVGRAFGKNQNIHLLWYPVAFEFANFTDGSISLNGNTIRDVDIDESCTNIKTCFYANFQWGKNLLRNGLYTGVDVYMNSTGDIKSTTGAQWVIGYKLSFAI